jgi:DNA polymerase-3 subunit delta
MSLAMIKKAVQSGTYLPVYLWYGEDGEGLLRAKRMLIQACAAADPTGLSVESFGGKELDIAQVVGAARTPSFFASRLVIVEDLLYFAGGEEKTEKVSKAKKGKKDESSADLLLDYCQNPNPENCLVLIVPKVNRTRKLYKEIDKQKGALEFRQPEGQEWVTWLRAEAGDRGRELSVETARFFLEWSGRDTSLLGRELDKLTMYCEGAITQAAIEAACAPRRETTVFALLDDWATGKTEGALRKLALILEEEHYFRILTMLVRQARLLLAAVLTRKRGGSEEDFRNLTKVSPYEGKKVFSQSRNFTPGALARLLEACLRTEVGLKSGEGQPELLLEMLLMQK